MSEDAATAASEPSFEKSNTHTHTHKAMLRETGRMILDVPRPVAKSYSVVPVILRETGRMIVKTVSSKEKNIITPLLNNPKLTVHRETRK